MIQEGLHEVPYDEVRELEALLGDPYSSESQAFSYDAIVRHDETNALDQRALEVLQDFGFSRLTVPEAFGGLFRNLEQLGYLTRLLARRNPTLAVKYGSSLLGANVIWLWGTDEQRRRVASAVAGGGYTAFAVSEKAHGSDLLATETRVSNTPKGISLTGEKWPIGNATTARFIVVLAKAPNGLFDLYLIDKNDVPSSCYEHLEQVPTVGLRGHDLSGIKFQQVPLRESDRLGRPGAGLAIVLKALQITKTGIGAISVGVLDAVVDIVTRYATSRRLYGSDLFALPSVRQKTTALLADRMICTSLLVPITRAQVVAPRYFSLWSSAVKALIPTVTDESIQTGSQVLAARSYIKGDFAGGVFQKLQRDHAIAAIFEGTTSVNLHSIASQLPALELTGNGAAELSLLDELFNTSEPAPVWQPNPGDLRLTNEGHDPLLSSLPETIDALVAALIEDVTDDSQRTSLLRTSGELKEAHGRLADPATYEDWSPGSIESFQSAEQYTLLLATACVSHTQLRKLRAGGDAKVAAQWTTAMYHRLSQRLEISAVSGFRAPVSLDDLIDFNLLNQNPA